MARTNSDKVAAIIEVDDAIPLGPFIDAANELVTEVCATILDVHTKAPYYSDVRLEMIETWLTAHFYAIRDPRLTSVAPTGLSVSYESQVALGFNLTRYGQQALRLDTKSGLATLEKRTLKGGGKLGVLWMGTDYCHPPRPIVECEDE